MASRTYRRTAFAFVAVCFTACGSDNPTAVIPDPDPLPGNSARYDLVYEETLANNLNGVRLRVRSLDGGGDSALFGVDITGASPSVNADGRVVVFVGAGSDPDGYDYQDLWRIVRGGAPQRIPLQLGTEFSPSVSPDGQRIAYIRLGEDGHTHLYLADITGQNERELSFAVAPGLQQGFSGPSWSPDGTKLLFSAGEPGAQHLWMVGADGRRLSQLTEASVSDIDGAWSPDGKQVAFVRSASPASGRLMVLNLDTGVERDFGYAWRNRYPSWSPDGTRIAFASNMHDNADLELFTVRPDGTGLTQLTDDNLRQQAPRWLRR